MKSVRLIACFPAPSTSVVTDMAGHPPALLAGKAHLLDHIVYISWQHLRKESHPLQSSGLLIHVGLSSMA